MSHATAIDLLRDASLVLPAEWIMQVYEMYRLHVTNRPGLIEKIPGEAYDGAVSAMDDAGWLNEEGALFIPDDVYERISSEKPALFTVWLENHRIPEPRRTPSGAVQEMSKYVLGYHCALYVWCAKQGLL